MKPMIILLLVLSPLCIFGAESMFDGYDGDKFKLVTEERRIDNLVYIIDDWYYKNENIIRVTIVDNGVAVRFAERTDVFLATVESQQDKLIVVGSKNGGIKFALKLNGSLRYQAISSDEMKRHLTIMHLHFNKLYMGGN